MMVRERIGRLVRRVAAEGFLQVQEPPLQEWWKRFEEQPWTVLVVGEYNAGKSMLINALLGEERAKVGPTPTTKEFTPYLLAGEGQWGIRLMDSPGLNDPLWTAKDRREFFDGLNCTPADLVLLVVSSGFSEEIEVFRELGETLAGRRVVVALNLTDDFQEADIEQLVHSQRAKIATLCARADVAGIVPVNADSAFRGKTKGKLLLLKHSGIRRLESLLRDEERAWSQKGDAAKVLLQSCVDALEGPARSDLRALALLAEARVLQRLRVGGASLPLSPDTVVVGGDLESLKAALREQEVVEIRPASNELYVDLLGLTSDRPILRRLESMEFTVESPVTAIVGLEVRNCRIRRLGGDLFILASDLRTSTIHARDRADVWLGQVDLGDLQDGSAISLEDRCRLQALRVTLHDTGGFCRADGTSIVNRVSVEQKGQAQPSPSRKRLEVQVKGIAQLPSGPQLFGLFGGYVFALLDGKALALYEVSTGRLTDQLIPWGPSSDGGWVFFTIADISSNSSADLLIVKAKETIPGAYVGTVRGGGWSGRGGDGRPSWVAWDRPFESLLIGDDGSVWTYSGREISRCELSADKAFSRTFFAGIPERSIITSISLVHHGVVALTRASGTGVWRWELYLIDEMGGRLLNSGTDWDGSWTRLSPHGDRIAVRLYRERKGYKWFELSMNDPSRLFEIPLPGVCSSLSWLPDGQHLAAMVPDTAPRLMILGKQKDAWDKLAEIPLDFLLTVDEVCWGDNGSTLALRGGQTVVVLDLHFEP